MARRRDWRLDFLSWLLESLSESLPWAAFFLGIAAAVVAIVLGGGNLAAAVAGIGVGVGAIVLSVLCGRWSVLLSVKAGRPGPDRSRCAGCGYSMAGLQAGRDGAVVCPECGQVQR